MTTINAQQRRLIDLEPYTVNRQRSCAFVWARNDGEAGERWHWNYQAC